MSRFDKLPVSNDEFDTLEKLKAADDVGIQPGYIDFSSGWENAHRDDLPEDFETTEIDLRDVSQTAIQAIDSRLKKLSDQ